MGLKLMGRINVPSLQRQLHEAGLSVVRIKIDDHDNQVRPIVRALAVTNQLIVIDRVKFQTPIVLKSRVLSPDAVHR